MKRVIRSASAPLNVPRKSNASRRPRRDLHAQGSGDSRGACSAKQTYRERLVIGGELRRRTEAGSLFESRERFFRCWSFICRQRWRIAHNSRSLLQDVSLIIGCGSVRSLDLRRTVAKPKSAVAPAIRVNTVRFMLRSQLLRRLFFRPSIANDRQ